MNARRFFSGLAMAFVACASVVRAQDDRPLFETVEIVGTLRYVKANRAGVSAWSALRKLETLGAFELKFELPELREILEKNTMSLSFDRMEAVTVAELCAVASGLDITTDRQPPVDGKPGKLVATVVRAPASDSDAGRQRLLDWGLRWYRNLLENELSSERPSATAEAKIRIDAALLDMARGNWSAAASGFRWLADTNPKHPWVSEALLREAECRLAAGEYDEATRRASRVMKTYRSEPVGVRAAIVYGKAALTQERQQRMEERFVAATTTLDSVVVQIELFLASFRGREEYPDLLLVLAEAQRRRGDHDAVLESLARIEAIVDPILLPRDQWVAANFLRGSAQLALGNIDDGKSRLWRFMRLEPKHPNVGIAWLAIADTELATDSLSAMFAARKALDHGDRLTPREQSRAMVIEAKAGLKLGDVNTAVDRLVAQIRARGPEKVPHLVVEVGDALLRVGKYERAKEVLTSLEKVNGPFADRARVGILKAEAKQGQPRAVVRLAKQYAARTENGNAQSEIAQLAGDAYRALGMTVDAAQAYDGRIR